MDRDDCDVGKEAKSRERKEPGEALAMGAAAGRPLKVSAYRNQGRGQPDDPKLVRVQKTVKFTNETRQKRQARGRASGRGDEEQRRQPAAQGVQPNNCGVREMCLARTDAVML